MNRQNNLQIVIISLKREHVNDKLDNANRRNLTWNCGFLLAAFLLQG